MGILGGHGLKHEHKVYKEDFTSKEEFERYLKAKEEKLEEIKNKIIQSRDKHWDYFANHDLEDTVFDKFDDMIDMFESKQTLLKDKISDLKE